MGVRIVVAVVLTALLLAVLYFGGIVQGIIFTAAALLCVYEAHKMFIQAQRKPFIIPAYIFAALYWIAQEYVGLWLLVLIWFFCLLAVMIERVCNPMRTAEDAMTGITVLVWPLACITTLMLLGEISVRSMALTGVILAFAAPLLGDTFAYFIGVFFGKHKLCPAISEKKTIEGSCAYVVGSVVAGLLLFWLQDLWQGTVPLLAILALAFICGFVGQLGDLFASTWKRWAGIKDFGALFPGHGGMLDRIDSVLMCAPIIFSYFCLISGAF